MADEPKKPTLSNMEAIVAEAIYKDLGAEKREELIKLALAGLLAKETKNGSYGEKWPSHLEQCFQSSINRIAADMVRAKFEKDDDLHKQIEAVIADALKKALTGDAREKLVNDVAKAVTAAFNFDRGY